MAKSKAKMNVSGKAPKSSVNWRFLLFTVFVVFVAVGYFIAPTVIEEYKIIQSQERVKEFLNKGWNDIRTIKSKYASKEYGEALEWFRYVDISLGRGQYKRYENDKKSFIALQELYNEGLKLYEQIIREVREKEAVASRLEYMKALIGAAADTELADDMREIVIKDWKKTEILIGTVLLPNCSIDLELPHKVAAHIIGNYMEIVQEILEPEKELFDNFMNKK